MTRHHALHAIPVSPFFPERYEKLAIRSMRLSTAFTLPLFRPCSGVARLASVSVAPENVDELMALYRNSVVPALREKPGFRQVMLFEAEGKVETTPLPCASGKPSTLLTHLKHAL